MRKHVIGLSEKVRVLGKEKHKDVMARIDTGAMKSSIDESLVAELRLGPIKRTMLIKSATGKRSSPVIDVNIILNGERFKREFTVAKRSYMKYKVLIGVNILKKGFVVDPSKK